MKAFLGIVVIAVSMLSPAAAQQTSPDDNRLIVPGQRIGPFKLGASMRDLSTAGLDVLDVTQSSKTAHVVVVWVPRGSVDPKRRGREGALITVHRAECRDDSTQNKCGALQIITVHDATHAFATADGLRIGVAEKQVREVLGEPNRDVRETVHRRLLLYSSGIFFGVDDSDGEYKVMGIAVRAPNCLQEEACE